MEYVFLATKQNEAQQNNNLVLISVTWSDLGFSNYLPCLKQKLGSEHVDLRLPCAATQTLRYSSSTAPSSRRVMVLMLFQDRHAQRSNTGATPSPLSGCQLPVFKCQCMNCYDRNKVFEPTQLFSFCWVCNMTSFMLQTRGGVWGGGVRDCFTNGFPHPTHTHQLVVVV